MRLPRLLVLILLSIAVTSGLIAVEQKPASSMTKWVLDDTSHIGEYPITLLGRPAVIESTDGKGVHFNGSSDGLLVPVNPIANCAAFTIEVLFKPETGGLEEQRFLHIQDQLGSRALLEIRLKDNRWALDTFLYSLKTESQCPLLDRTKLHPADQWTWVALVYADGHMAHYINGEKELEGSVNFSPMQAGQISLGVRQNKVFWFKGSMREVRFHASALSTEALQRVTAK